jgi:hypothetical protein
MFRLCLLGILLACLSASSLAVTTEGQGSGFTYQGVLSNQGRPANGLYDLQFRLADAPTNGTYLGDVVTYSSVPVSNGLFSVILSFDPSLFDGTIRWLELSVRTNGSQSLYTVLEPLQPIASVPYAVFANSAAVAGIASNLVAGAVLTNVTIQGSSIQWGSITAAQIDAATDAAYRNVDTNTITAIVANMSTSSTSGGTNPRRLDVKVVFGAKGDGVTDDTAAIQSGLDYMGSYGATNLTLYFPPGTYKLTSTLSVPPTISPPDPVLGGNSGYRLSGGGLSATKLVWPTIGNGIGLALTNVGPGYEGVTIEDLTLIGPLMTAWDQANTSIGIAFGKYGPDTSWSGFNNTVRNCGIIGWAYGAAVTNQWIIVFDNCTVASNNLEGLRFVGSHNVSVQNCKIGGDWFEACGIGIGFHPPMNNGYGDNAQIMNCLIGPCTNGIVNNELNLLSLNNHLERCGSFYTLLKAPSGAPMTTIIGGYTLDYGDPWSAGFAGQINMDSACAAVTILANPSLYSTYQPARPMISITDDGSGFGVPTYLGPGTLTGLWGGVSNLTVYSFGFSPKSSKPIWTYQLPLRNGPDFISGINNAISPAPWSVAGAMQIAAGSVGTLEFAIPHAMGFSNVVVELTVQGVAGENNMSFKVLSDNYSIGPTGSLPYGQTVTGFAGITDSQTSTFYWTNSFGEDIYPRRCRYTISSFDDHTGGLTNDLWMVSWKLFSVETASN